MKTKGFTLIELMIVVAIIAIIAAIAIPNLLRSRMSANEANAAGAMRIISTGEVGFQTAGFVDADADGVGDYGAVSEPGRCRYHPAVYRCGFGRWRETRLQLHSYCDSG